MTMTDHAKDYIAGRKALGMSFKTQERTLMRYAEFADARGDTFMLARSVLDWAGTAASVGAAQRRLRIVRGMAVFLHAGEALVRDGAAAGPEAAAIARFLSELQQPGSSLGAAIGLVALEYDIAGMKDFPAPGVFFCSAAESGYADQALSIPETRASGISANARVVPTRCRHLPVQG